MKFKALFLNLVIILALTAWKVPDNPPYSNTSFLAPDIILNTDQSLFSKVQYLGIKSREAFDRRSNSWIHTEMYIFGIKFTDDTSMEGQVNLEFENKEAAQMIIEKYGFVIGQIPKVLRQNIRTMTIHQGYEDFGGQNGNLLIYADTGNKYLDTGTLEEIIIHEAAHVALDHNHAKGYEWKQMQEADNRFISVYADENPYREDVAESFLMWLAVKFREERIGSKMKLEIERSIPHRLTYFDKQNFDVSPIK